MNNLTALPFAETLNQISAVLPPDLPVFVVGGAVRDALLGRAVNDLDFVLPGPVLEISRRVANALHGAYYPLDEERQTARIILNNPDGERRVLDFAALRGPDLESDLRARDFTINAMALAVGSPARLIDPLSGALDLRARRLRACSELSFLSDPIRIVRAVRQAVAFQLRIEPQTLTWLRDARPGLAHISPERLRDELFRILQAEQPATALRTLDFLDALRYLLPELELLKGVEQSAPHYQDVFQHTLEVNARLAEVLATLAPVHDQEQAASWALGLISLQLGRYRSQIAAHLATDLNPLRSLRGLLFLAALYHDSAKPQTRSVEVSPQDGRERVRFFEHDLQGVALIAQRAQDLRLSNIEIERLKTIIRHHMRPLLLAQSGAPPSRRAIYRFFRDTGPAGVDICLLSLADTLGTYGPRLERKVWVSLLEVVRTLLAAWWENPEERISPPALVNGRDLMETFDLEPGPAVGQLLSAIREAQATGEVTERVQALALAQKLLGAR
ncbi:MAG TPA: HD domain-containing protein [Anaerolineales bacterium]|nr:HD domain-containing protein [Anaerolineales bacterium]